MELRRSQMNDGLVRAQTADKKNRKEPSRKKTVCFLFVAFSLIFVAQDAFKSVAPTPAPALLNRG